ncbi:hypothetical protein TMatcc_002457 [Talaromyces marneffei ATCC 18224]|uniref:uncharacterized protein n=1 Tax=Talaromyces marneffei TaxID=37727 RepID=UPI0012A88B0B|nr:uncharacterized protein EYB26_006399 [Talaromyces marneffei]KAE8552412.1 hypothetical protein EYB25_006306 [Talaromyces marneffei]QGA18714.1 hypothetical protein EYB26_006399 [Talaromyces marneffei]
MSTPELFHYSETHRVLICTSCRYAVQPAALVRHLKDIHHLSSDKRRHFDAYKKTLRLKSPEEVKPPLPQDFPVPYLPVEKGWQCEFTGCDYLCVSKKRMETHWPAEHGRKGLTSRDWSPTLVQTFFRGNMLKYFSRDSRSRLAATTQMTPAKHPERIVANIQDEMISQSKLQYVRKIQQKYSLDSVDCWILHQYLTSTYKSFANDDETEHIWREVVPDLAHGNKFLLHGLLACTAQYMIHMNFPQPQELILRACSHQDYALPAFREAIDNPTNDNCDAMMTFAYLLVVYMFATSSANSSDSLLFVANSTDCLQNNSIVPLWLVFLRDGCAMLCDVWDRIESGPLATLAAAWELDTYDGNDLPYWTHFSNVALECSSWSKEEVRIYGDASLLLARCFATMEREPNDSWVTTWKILGLWPMRVESEFMTLLYSRQPGALILLAYYCIILKKMERYWYFEGGSAKLMLSIVNVLEQRWHPFIREPVDLILEN